MRPQGVALPILNCAVWLERANDKIVEIRIAIGPAGPIPFRALETEVLIRGKTYGKDLMETALEALLAEARFRTSPQRASSDYRKHLGKGLFLATTEATWLRAGEV
jgi:carbon-monoxide dehydrogenase medium subunit